MKKNKIGFLYLGPISHIYHSISIAFNLSNHTLFDVTLFVSSELNFNTIKIISKLYRNNRCKIEHIHPSLFHKCLRFFKKRDHPRVRNVLQKNKKKLLNFNGLILTDRHFINGKERKPSYFLADHGAGDRARGYTDAINKFDFILVSGQEKWNRMREYNYISEQKGRIIGYPKFDTVSLQVKNKRLFNNDKPVVIYNPHFNKKETSWYLWGKRLLEHFLIHKDYNLIFAPHILLFNKGKFSLKKEYYEAENIHIDVNTSALIDMTYTINSNIYIGDVSSQVYEFVAFQKRPCIFLNPHHVKWQKNRSFRMWKMGDVINNMNHFESTLFKAVESHSAYEKIQGNLIQETFSIKKESAGERGAKAIIDFFESHKT